MQRTKIADLQEHVGEEVKINGWVDTRRDHGQIAFFDIRDGSSSVQTVAKDGMYDQCEKLRREWVVAITGEVNERPDDMINEDEANGSIELEITDLDVLNEAKTPPFELEDTYEVEETTRLNHRYLDLRTDRLQKNIRLRSEFVQRCRQFLFGKDFTEIETPLLTKSTPEGSRDFVVPSRHHEGKFYALPQSPQQYKQLLMCGGFERYFQIARVARDEDLRADRSFEHTQIDLEMSFVDQEDVMDLIEAMITHVAEDMGYKIKDKPFPRIPYEQAIQEHGDDKFDLRTQEEKEAGVLAYAWVVDFPFFEKDGDGGWTFTHNPFSMPKEKDIEKLLAGEDIGEIKTQQYDLVCNGFESGGGSIRAHKPEILKATYQAMGHDEEYIQEHIGHMLEAFSYGAPPHGGIALGVERNVMNLTDEDDIREVQAFPMTRTGKTAVMDAPQKLSAKQLHELGLSVETENEPEE